MAEPEPATARPIRCLRRADRGAPAGRRQPEVGALRHRDRRLGGGDGPRDGAGGDAGAARGGRPRPVRLPDRAGGRADGPRLLGLARPAVRLGGAAGVDHSAPRRHRRPAGGHRALHPAGQRRRAAHPGLHALPRRARSAGPGADRGADGRARRADDLRPRRHRPGTGRRRRAGGPRQPAQPAGPRVHGRGAARVGRGRRPARRPGLLRRDPRPAGVPGRRAPALRLPVRRHRPPRADGDVGVQGVEPARPQGGAARPVRRRRRRALGAGGLPLRARRLHPRACSPQRPRTTRAASGWTAS